MRNPWRTLAVLLAIVLGLVIILRSPAARSAEFAAGRVDDQARASEAAASGSLIVAAFSPERQAAIEAEAEGDVTLLLRLVHADGSPAEAWCTFHPTDGSRTWARMTHGVGVLLGIRPGPAQIRITGRGYYSTIVDVLIADAPAEQELRLIVEPSARIAVRFVTPDGRRLVEVLKERLPAQQAYAALPSIFALRQGNLPLFTPRGEFDYQSPDAMWSTPQELVNLPIGLDGELSLLTRPPMILHALLRHRPVAMQALEAPIEALDFVVDPERLLAELGSVRVRLLDGLTGERFASGYNCSVSLQGTASMRLQSSAGDGTYGLEGLPPGAYILNANAQDRASWRQFLLLEPGATYDAGEIRLQSPASAQLRLIDPKGKPIVKVRGWALDVRRLSNLFMFGRSSYLSDDAGEVKISRVEQVEHLFSFVPPVETNLGAGYVRLTPSLAAGTAQEVRVKPGIPVKLSGLGQDLLQHEVWILLDGLAPVPGGRYANLPITILLPPGSHAWMLTDAAGREVRRGALHVEEGMKELKVEVPLP